MHVLVLRFSALGDVAILQPVLKHRAAANPDVRFTVAAPKIAYPLFADIPNVEYLPIDKHRPLREIWNLLWAVRPDVVADIHGVLRTVRLDVRFRLRGVKVCIIDKGRAERRRLLRREHKDLTPLKPSWQRYDDVFERLGLAGAVSLSDLTPVTIRKPKTGIRNIGIAPFAQHQGKIWPLCCVERLIALLMQHPENRIFLFGSNSEVDRLELLAKPFAGRTMVCAGIGTLYDDMQVMRSLNVLLSMDSANMHIASCLGVPVVSIWGATHPANGFYGWCQNPDWAIQADLPCRPCSMFGNNPCRYGDYHCLKTITPEHIADRLENF